MGDIKNRFPVGLTYRKRQPLVNFLGGYQRNRRLNCSRKRGVNEETSLTKHEQRNRCGERGENVNTFRSPNILFIVTLIIFASQAACSSVLTAHNINACKRVQFETFETTNVRHRSTTSYLVTWNLSLSITLNVIDYEGSM